MDKREVTSSESNNYMGIPCKGLTTSLTLSTKRSNKKQKERFYITDITSQDFRKLLKKFKNYKSHRMDMFISTNAVKNDSHQPSNARAQHRKKP